MTIVERISAVLAFRTIPTTVVLVALYAVISWFLVSTDDLPTIPKNQGGLSVADAYVDLHKIASQPHPYNSHANDVVRDYIQERLQNITTGHSFAHFASDTVSNGSWAEAAGVYFEGNNLMVKIDGTQNDTNVGDGVLFSAHLDSVSTAPGATDDGMAVATLIQLAQYFTRNRPRKTVVFNINNGEEDWLNGAHAFMQHPWSRLVDTFLNLEGASSGGRPTLFRATAKSPVLSFKSKNVYHPSGNVLSSDAFARGIIRSGTDYQVYASPLGNMNGLDFAFYKGRSKYHTKYDAIPYTDGLDKALWAMMETALGAGKSLANDDRMHAPDSGPPVYFDLFSTFFVLFSLSTLFTIDIVLLVVGPVVLLLLVACEAVLQHTRSLNGRVDPRENTLRRFLADQQWFKSIWGPTKFWLALLVSAALQALLVFAFVSLNPFVAYASSAPALLLLSFTSLSYLSLTTILNLPLRPSIPFTKKSRADTLNLPEHQKDTILLQTYILTWILLLLATIAPMANFMGGTYWITAWNGAVLLGSAIGSLEGILGVYGTRIPVDDGPEGGGVPSTNGERTYVRGVRYEAPEETSSANGAETAQDVGVEVETEPTEITPLLVQQQEQQVVPSSSKQAGKEEGGAILWWFLQALLVVPVPVVLIGHVLVLLVGALPQTLSDGNSAVTVYAVISLLSLLFVLPIAPFSFKLSSYLTLLMAVVFVSTTTYALVFMLPFSQEAPLKVFFQQHLQVDLGLTTAPAAGIMAGKVGTPITTIAGVLPYTSRDIISQLPSSLDKPVICVSELSKKGLHSCSWESDLIPSPGGPNATTTDGANKWLVVNATRLNDTSILQFTIRGHNTRNCRLYFDDPISSYVVHGSHGHGEMQTGFTVPEKGVKEVRLWSREWGKTFVVYVKPTNASSDVIITGRAACEWVEYESASVGAVGGAGEGGRIPALEEALRFLPSWAVATKLTDGLVEVWGSFAV